MRYLAYFAIQVLLTTNLITSASLYNTIVAGDLEHVRKLIADPNTNIFNRRPGNAVLLARRCLHEAPDNAQRKQILGLLQLEKTVHLKRLQKKQASASQPLTEDEKQRIKEAMCWYIENCSSIGRSPLVLLPHHFPSWPKNKLSYGYQILLSQESSDPNVCEGGGYSALHYLINWNHTSAVEALLHDPRTRIDISYKGMTALNFARKGVEERRPITLTTLEYLKRKRRNWSLNPQYNNGNHYFFAIQYKQYQSAVRIAALLRMKEWIQRWKQHNNK